ncbi:cytochrome c oxidase assembly protein COX11, mitochondrial-like isoform X3 [Carya illinoinensis]|uniref:cytochrome c oxidase assembly protein COX11, mitochondrial-like isoform X3 n=1 Tax=Carya illinoinensis TaxID=32201 RepID=UPI001C7297D8|nr:cytochrome c oxidase assembly protein COX11, mitochondrial-like isoform X3 [Carya illinoinensis]
MLLFHCTEGSAKLQGMEALSSDKREIVVQFNADVADGMPWKFVPTQREVRVKPGESALASYTAENRSSAPITGVSTYNVTPYEGCSLL